MGQPLTYQQYQKRVSLTGILLYTLSQEVPALEYSTKIARLRRLPKEEYVTEAGPCFKIDYGNYRGEVWDYDESWVIYNRSPEKPFFFNHYLFPRDYFLAAQRYVQAALENKLDASASIRDKALWAIDVLAHINFGLLATNLHAEVLGDLSLINDINAVSNQPALNSIVEALLDSYTHKTHPIWTYTRNVWKKTNNNPMVHPLMCAEFSDLLLLPATVSADMLNNLYGMSRLVKATCTLQFAPNQRMDISVPYGSWQDSGRHVVNTMPWLSNGLVKPLEGIHRDLYGDPKLAEMGFSAHKAFGLGGAYNNWMLLNVYRIQKWYIDRKWYRADSTKVPAERRFRSLGAFLESLSSSPGAITRFLGLGKDRISVVMPNFAYIYANGGIDAWAKYFTSLRYKEYIEAGAHMWGQALAETPSTSVWEMQQTINENLEAPKDTVSSAADAIINLGVDTAASTLKTLTAAALTGTVASFATLGAGGIIGGAISLFSTIIGIKSKARSIRAQIREYKAKLLDRYRVMPQIFIRVVPKDYRQHPTTHSYSTDVGTWTQEAALEASAAALRVARAFAALVDKIPDDFTPAGWFKKPSIDMAPVPAPQAPVDLAEIARITSKTYKPTHPNLFRHPDVGDLWVTDAAAQKLQQSPGWVLVKRQAPALMAPRPTTNRRKAAAIVGTMAAAALAWAIGLV